VANAAEVSITPAEVRHLRLPRRPLGLSKRKVRRELDRVADSFETTWRERADLIERAEESDAELRRYREMDEMLRRTLMSAERSADGLREGARRDASAIIRDAEQRGREIVGEAHAERERIRRDMLRLRETEREFRTRLRSVMGSAERLVSEYEADLSELPVEEP